MAEDFHGDKDFHGTELIHSYTAAAESTNVFILNLQGESSVCDSSVSQCFQGGSWPGESKVLPLFTLPQRDG